MSRGSLSRACCQCGAAFNYRPSHEGRAKFCSRSCRSTFTARRTAERRGDMLRGRGEGRTYRKRGGKHEHRAAAEKKIGRSLLPGEVVHHIDGDHLNNDPDNLAVITQSEHMRLHGLGIPGEQPKGKPWIASAISRRRAS